MFVNEHILEEGFSFFPYKSSLFLPTSSQIHVNARNVLVLKLYENKLTDLNKLSFTSYRKLSSMIKADAQ